MYKSLFFSGSRNSLGGCWVQAVSFLCLPILICVSLGACRRQAVAPATPNKIPIVNVHHPEIIKLLYRLNEDDAVLAFYHSEIATLGNPDWAKALVTADGMDLRCLIPFRSPNKDGMSAALAVHWGHQLAFTVIRATEALSHDTSSRAFARARLFGLCEYAMTGVQRLAGKSILFKKIEGVQGVTSSSNSRAFPHAVSVCYEWTTCTGDGWGNCVGRIYYHSECFTETLSAGGFDYGYSGGGIYPGYGNPYAGGIGGGNSLYNGKPIIFEPPRLPVLDAAAFMRCFDLNLPATVTIYADQPVPGYDEPVSITGGIGHAFVTIEQRQGSTIIKRTIGFYSSERVNPFSRTSAESRLGDDQGRDYDVSISVIAAPGQVKAAIQAIIDYPAIYDIEHYNCANFVLDVAQAAGMTLPRTKGWWFVGKGNNPGALGQDMRAIPGSRKTPGKAPVNEGLCP